VLNGWLKINLFVPGFSVTTVGEEKLLNPRLSLSKEEFVEFMKKLNLKYPKLIGRLLNVLCAWRHNNYVTGIVSVQQSHRIDVTVKRNTCSTCFAQ